MALALLLNQRSKGRPGKGETFGCKFDANFRLESSTVRPFAKLSGQLVIDSPAPISHYGIRVQYEAICTLKFESKLDSRIRLHSKCANILEGEDKEVIDGYLESPVKIDLERILRVKSSETCPYELQSGVNTYGFNISIPGEFLPAPFKNTYGSLIYKLVAYMRSETGMFVQIGEKALKFSGYYDLSMNVNVCRGIVLEKSTKKSMFTGKKLMIAKLKLDNRGYLPEELLRFTMSVQNPKCLPFKMSVFLLQKVMYAVNTSRKTTIAILGSAEKDIAEPELETVWDGVFKIHKMASPTYSGRNPMYTVSHLIQFKVKVDDGNLMKSEHLVFLGTTRETLEASVGKLDLDGSGSSRLERRSSVVSNTSNYSLTGNPSARSTKPPLFSQLSLSARMSSVESCTAGYEEFLVADNENSQRATPTMDDPNEETAADLKNAN